MTKELEERLAALEKELLKSKSKQRSGLRFKLSGISMQDRLYVLAGMILSIVILSAGLIYIHQNENKSPVPATIADNLKYTLYYPAPNKMPAGYILDKKSFIQQEGAVIYVVNHGSDKIIFSVQAKPDNKIIQDFEAKQIPLHTSVSTSLGTALIGAIGGKTIISLATNTNSWLLVTAPDGIDQGVIVSLLNALKS